MPQLPVDRNVAANFAGNAWAALIALAVVPVYIHLMGIEAWGVVGILVSLQAIFAMLDLGLSQTLSREMARLSVDPGNRQAMADTACTIEVVYACASVAVALLVLGAAQFIAHEWLRPEHLSREAVRDALWIMALVIGLRWPLALYQGAMAGIQRQVLLNGLLAGFATVQALGGVAVLRWIAPSVQNFLLWQGACALVQVGAMRIVLFHCIAPPRPPRFDIAILHGLWRFAAGITAIAVVSMLLTQVDKILLSRMLTLADFGYYVFATTVAGALYALTTAVHAAYQPRFAALAALPDTGVLARVYHHACRTMAVAIIPAGVVLALFSTEFVAWWTRNPELAARSGVLVSLLVVGNLLHGLMHLPYALQVAFGWTRLALVSNAIAVAVLVPTLYVAIGRWGAPGAAVVWIVLNLGYLCITVQLMHRRLLPREQRRWYVEDVAIPLLAVLAVAAPARAALPAPLPSPWFELALAAVSAAALGAAWLTTRAGRP
ncbi:lipopolysaccharide biosynthesis protein [Caenimonas aquaedulcis]|uniref:Oligosaccharide flippase family protein n=1 Tax=Caenimonas aquaedulcis TaxID=2793270 RepID=A0A931H5L8_9BURK|nr:oligosaccharide flippase family protein [Caenimonas aquaedulcis]MBG9388883.1 oligosaccharide flippase family protein [Caenimonas aquaedulcis]